MKVLRLIIVVICSGGWMNAAAQDLHFSQFMNAPLLTNPANTGFIPDGDYRLGVNYRNQWASITAFPYKTMSAYGDVQLLQNSENTGWLGVGAVILRDVAGASVLTSTKVYGSVAYHQMINQGSLVSLGFNAGWANKSINTANLSFPGQWNGQFFDAHQTTVAPKLDYNNISYFDMQVGMNYAYFPTEDIYINAGYSIHHVNRPKESFFADNSTDAIIPMRHIGFINAILKVNPRVIINPNIYFTTQAKSTDLMGGLNANYNLSEYGEAQLIAGIYYRYKDAVIPMVGLEIKNIRFTFSYDITTSSLNKFNSYRGASEFNLIKNGFYPDNVDRQSLCPKF